MPKSILKLVGVWCIYPLYDCIQIALWTLNGRLNARFCFSIQPLVVILKT